MGTYVLLRPDEDRARIHGRLQDPEGLLDVGKVPVDIDHLACRPAALGCDDAVAAVHLGIFGDLYLVERPDVLADLAGLLHDGGVLRVAHRASGERRLRVSARAPPSTSRSP